MSGRQKETSGLYTFAQAADRLGIGLSQAYRLDNDGKFPVPVVTFGAVRKVRIAELEDFLRGEAPALAPGCHSAEDATSEALRRIAAAALSLSEAARDLAFARSC